MEVLTGARRSEITAQVNPQLSLPPMEAVVLTTTTTEAEESFFLRATAIPFTLTDFSFRQQPMLSSFLIGGLFLAATPAEPPRPQCWGGGDQCHSGYVLTTGSDGERRWTPHVLETGVLSSPASFSQ